MVIRTQTTLCAILLTSMLLGACGSGNQTGAGPEHTDTDHHQHQTANGDLQETTASIKVLPSFLKGAAPEVIAGYETAATATDILPYIPCYCGCGESAGHKSNLNCFIAEMREDGSVVWDDHGTRCGVCLEIAVSSAALKASGIEPERIRHIIDETYKEGYAKPTITEMPPA
ncbi:PCYCGC motif-containing (lipo)protein [Paenibacillus harenae]|uniref:PCYCGC motif-containing (lipo)protein n=1 Tax=Paenibacillus harenae TaxID=306543 RepID=UPI00041EBE2C|nr:PCYCGC motif-containing (lipo)protein [Paenibacillus harenae]